jgi:2-polyprenyl-3-methyl-5-hydroxy-6-metoxy-1,4-benzoquinol methylase
VGIGLKRVILGTTAKVAPTVAPLSVRKRAARAVDRLPGRQKEAVILALLQDWATAEPAAYHRFVWSNHLSYARYYDFRDFPQSRSAYFERPHPLRVELLELVATYLRDQGIDPSVDVGSLLDVGSSLGYLLRYAETSVFPAATRMLGVDIDAYAIHEGAAHLARAGSAVELAVGDAGGLDALVGDERFDIVMCTGVLQYLDEPTATAAVGAMLGHTAGALALSGPAWPDADNATLSRSQFRDYDRSLIHNFDRMVASHGARVVARRWAGRDEQVEGKAGAYLVVAARDARAT